MVNEAGTKATGTLSFSLPTRKTSYNKVTIADAFTQEEEQQQQPQQPREARTSPLVIPLIKPEPSNSSLLSQRRIITTTHDNGDAVAANALIQSAQQHFQRAATPHSEGTNFDATGDLVIPVTSSTNTNDTIQFHKELQQLPNELDTNSQQYQTVPIQEFGAALLRGMGWNGTDTSGNIKDPTRRPHRLGLGAISKLQTASTTQQKLPSVDKQQTLQPGSLVYIPIHNKTKRGKMVQLSGVPGLNQVLVQLEGEDRSTAVNKSSVSLIPRADLEISAYQEVEEQTRPQPNDNDDDDKSHGKKQLKREREENKQKQQKKQKRNEEAPSHWIIPNIRVRIITRKLGSVYFLQKAIVMDVTSNGTATLHMNGQVLDKVPERYLETALPKVGGNVICLSVGKFKYTKGRLLERDKSKGVVQVFEDQSVVTFGLDDLAEWCRPLDDDEV